MNNEPVAYVDKIWIDRPDLVMSQDLDMNKLFARSAREVKNYIPLYTHPVKELTDEEIMELSYMTSDNDPIAFVRAILKKAQEK